MFWNTTLWVMELCITTKATITIWSLKIFLRIDNTILYITKKKGISFNYSTIVARNVDIEWELTFLWDYYIIWTKHLLVSRQSNCPPTTTSFNPSVLFYSPIRAGDVAWNWETFLINTSGKVIKRAVPSVDPAAQATDIELELAKA